MLLEHCAYRDETFIAIYKRPNDDILKELLSIDRTNGKVHHLRIYDIGRSDKIKIDCLNMYKNDGNNEDNLLAKWEHIISRDNGINSNVPKKSNLNIIFHSYEMKIYGSDFSERTILYNKKLGSREFNSEHLEKYKEDTLITFNGDKIDGAKEEFQEPIGITKPYHLPPSINIHNDPEVMINTEDIEWWPVKPKSFPWTFYITLAYNGSTKQPNFFKYESINVTHYRNSESNKLEKIKHEILKLDKHNNRVIILKEPVIIKFDYYCDNCITGGINVIQKVIFK
uniref:FHA domain-containing protein n=1 Tax=Strongyloides papillosus TaxID=174720 RepID=A0A0N5B5C2_STREA